MSLTLIVPRSTIAPGHAGYIDTNPRIGATYTTLAHGAQDIKHSDKKGAHGHSH